MDVKVKVTIKYKDIFFKPKHPFKGYFKSKAMNIVHKFFYHWNMFFMGTNKATSDVIAWDISTVAAMALIVVISLVNIFF